VHPYEAAKLKAQELRAEYGFSTPRVRRSDLRKIYRAEAIVIDVRPHLRHLRGAYFYDEEIGPTILLAAGLPDEPTIFTMGHELKHHFIDRPAGFGFLSFCAPANQAEIMEKAAEVFAAELIYPDADFIKDCGRLGMAGGACDAAAIVRLKRTSQTTLSYASLSKRATHFGFAQPGSLQGVAWRRLEESMFGEPVYKRVMRRRGSRTENPASGRS
jgi:Zn-dependent peptidase ImmA (M78 family)